MSGEDGQILLEIAEARTWARMTPADRGRFDRWVQEVLRGGHGGMNLALLLWEGHRRWRRVRHSSSQTLRAQTGPEEEK